MQKQKGIGRISLKKKELPAAIPVQKLKLQESFSGLNPEFLYPAQVFIFLFLKFAVA
jgi:hypothetical protein